MKISPLTKTSLLLFIFFGVDKLAAIARQLIIGRQFGLSAELDVFNVANNLPDLLFMLISGGALSMALIPVMTDTLSTAGKQAAWRLFSQIANGAFCVAAILAIVAALFAPSIVISEVGIAPGFRSEQQTDVIRLMRLNLIAMVLFSVSGLLMGGLQACKSFLCPALAPIFYNAGQIFGALVLAPDSPYRFGSLEIPCFGLGIDGLVYGVILGAALHLLIQIPGLISQQFCWVPQFGFSQNAVQRVYRILGPRVLSVFLIQLIFIARDNFASRLASGSVTALSYGYMFQQLPETLIGTAIGTAVLPFLAGYVSERNEKIFTETIEKACRFILALTLGVSVIMAVGLQPLIQALFGFDTVTEQLLLLTLRGFLVGLAGHCLLETANRAFYAQQEAVIPLLGTVLNLILYIGLGWLLSARLGVLGLSLTDSIAFTLQALFMLALLGLPYSKRLFQRRSMRVVMNLKPVLFRAGLGSAVAGAICILIMMYGDGLGNNLVKSVIAMAVSFMAYLVFILPEIKMMRNFGG